ncbi:MAG: glycerophosphodiester phosphodiesterase [Oscillospiraceae bacterium]
MTKIYAHRGFSEKYPENTLLAFKKAAETGAEGIELDVHLTKDGEIVVMHDENTVRTTGTNALIKDLTLEQFKLLDAGYVKKGEFGFEAPPALREVFELLAETGMECNIEIKSGVYEYPGIERKVLNLIDEFGLRDKIIISSFNHYTVCRFKELAPDVKCGFLEESWLIHPGAYTRNRGVECFHPFFNMLNHENVQDLRNNGIEINAWTINDEEDMRKALRLQLEIAITNSPDRFLEIRKEVLGK